MTGQAQLGRPAPDFTLPGSKGKSVSLSDFRGEKVVLYFYPHDMTPTCTQQACDFRDATPELRRTGAEIIGVSTDPVGKHEQFTEKYELPFLLLADEDNRVAELYGVWQLKKLYGREYMGTVRSTFLIDENGILVKEWRNIKIKNHVNAVLEAVRSL